MEQELRDRERFMREYCLASGVSIWELYLQFRERLDADHSPNSRCASCGLHMWQVGSLTRMLPGPPLCDSCRVRS